MTPTVQPAADADGVFGAGTFVSQIGQVAGGVLITKSGTDYTLLLEDYLPNDPSQLTLGYRVT